MDKGKKIVQYKPKVASAKEASTKSKEEEEDELIDLSSSSSAASSPTNIVSLTVGAQTTLEM